LDPKEHIFLGSAQRRLRSTTDMGVALRSLALENFQKFVVISKIRAFLRQRPVRFGLRAALG